MKDQEKKNTFFSDFDFFRTRTSQNIDLSFNAKFYLKINKRHQELGHDILTFIIYA